MNQCYVVYDAQSGQILRSGFCDEVDVRKQPVSEHERVLVTAALIDESKFRVKDGQITEIEDR